MLELRSVSVSIGETRVLSDISHVFHEGTITFIVGKNGSGKTSLALSIMGHPRYKLINGSILLNGKSIDSLSVSERATEGIFLSFQNIPEIPGVKLSEFLRTIYNEHLKRTNPETKPLTPFVFTKFVRPIFEKFSLPLSFLDRDLNVGFSGGEKRRVEMIQIELLSPKIVIIDEIDSGLDVSAFSEIGSALGSIATSGRIFIVITHNYRLEQYISPHNVLVMEKGGISKIANKNILQELEKNGF